MGIKKVKIFGEYFGYKPLLAKERDEIVDRNTTIDQQTGVGNQNTPNIIRESLAIMIQEVPAILKKEFKEEHGREWKGTADDWGVVSPQLEDKLAVVLSEVIGLGSEDKKDFLSKRSSQGKAKTHQ